MAQNTFVQMLFLEKNESSAGEVGIRSVGAKDYVPAYLLPQESDSLYLYDLF